MDFTTIKDLLDAVETGADKGIVQAQRNAENLKGIVSQARTIVGQLEASGIDTLIANFDVKTFWNEYKDGFKVKKPTGIKDVIDKATWLRDNAPEWHNLSGEEIKRMARLFPDVVERLFAEKSAEEKSGGSTEGDWKGSTDTP